MFSSRRSKRIFTLAFIVVILVFGLILRGVVNNFGQSGSLVENRIAAQERNHDVLRDPRGNIVFDDDGLFKEKISYKISKVEKTVDSGWKQKLNNKSNVVTKTTEIPKTLLQKKTPSKGKYRILFWDPLPYFLHPNEQLPLCKYKNCEVTVQKSDIRTSDAVVFYGPAHYGNIPMKGGAQVWIFMSMESPSNLFNSLTGLNNNVNWTWTYRRDSDIPASYGRIVRNEKPLQGFDPERLLERKNKSIAWFVSNCNSRSQRDQYFNLLKSVHPDVDVYGNCGQLTCKYEDSRCRTLLDTTYKFYLSFENSLCRDYVTEKVLAKIGNVVIPIVRGGGDYSVYLPPTSYIDTSKFNNVSELGATLKSIASDKRLYGKFHEWRRHYRNQEHKDIVNYEEGWCEICEKLNHQDKYRHLYADFSKWWAGDAGDTGEFCHPATDLRL